MNNIDFIRIRNVITFIDSIRIGYNVHKLHKLSYNVHRFYKNHTHIYGHLSHIIMQSQYAEDCILGYLVQAGKPCHIDEICNNITNVQKSTIRMQLKWMVKVKNVEICRMQYMKPANKRFHWFYQVTERGRAVFKAGGYH